MLDRLFNRRRHGGPQLRPSVGRMVPAGFADLPVLAGLFLLIEGKTPEKVAQVELRADNMTPAARYGSTWTRAALLAAVLGGTALCRAVPHTPLGYEGVGWMMAHIGASGHAPASVSRLSAPEGSGAVGSASQASMSRHTVSPCRSRVSMW